MVGFLWYPERFSLWSFISKTNQGAEEVLSLLPCSEDQADMGQPGA